MAVNPVLSITHVDNVVAANLLAMAAPPATCGVFNVACDEPHTIIELLERLNVELGTQIAPQFVKVRPGDDKHSHAAIGRAAASLGYRPVTGFVEGIRQTVQWHRDTICTC